MEIKIIAQKFYDHSLYIRGYSVETIKRYRNIINMFVSFTGITDVTDVTDDNVKKLFYDGRTKRKWKTNTFITYHKSLVVFFRWCIEEGYIDSNPAESLECPKLEKRIPPKLTKQDAMRLLEIVFNYPYKYPYLRYRNHAIFAVFLFAGIRKRELINLKLTDIDIENLTLFVRQGKGAKDRIIPINYRLTAILKKYLEERSRLGKTAPEFFCSLNRNMGITDTCMKRLVEKFRKETDIVFTIHKLRHTFATLMLEGGCDLFSLSKMMGHEKLETTSIYLQASAEHLRKQMIKHPLNDI
ncbi:hypothetical protein C0583_04575 [Candidatus Parcubacteria bacterium]|nr:MAG: hypothetical protein C0583_04575 [Candidatus Parcubacteria bacterium]